MLKFIYPISLCLSLSHSVSLCRSLSLSVSLCLSLHLSVDIGIPLSLFVSFCLSLFRSVSLCLAMSRLVTICLSCLAWSLFVSLALLRSRFEMIHRLFWMIGYYLSCTPFYTGMRKSTREWNWNVTHSRLELLPSFLTFIRLICAITTFLLVHEHGSFNSSIGNLCCGSFHIWCFQSVER